MRKNDRMVKRRMKEMGGHIGLSYRAKKCACNFGSEALREEAT
jgi:hypothetical protein